MIPLQAIQAPTRNAAQALGREHDVSAIAVGRNGDIVAVTGDPLANVRLTEAPDAVGQGRRNRRQIALNRSLKSIISWLNQMPRRPFSW